ncbi:MAG: MFS transporter [Oscillospiraceae bacterium]|nr:MFS transporter [Oscillospiraceae bacterium]
MKERNYYPTALALYITYFVLGIAASIMGQYKQAFAALWGANVLSDGLYDVSAVVSVIAAIGLGRLIAFPIAGPLSDRLGRRLSALIGCALYAVFLLSITFTKNMYVAYVLAIISGMANSFLDTSITPSCMEIFKEKGTIANIFTKLSISIAQFLLPFAIGYVASENLPFNTIFLVTAAIIIIDGIALAFLPFPPFERTTGKKEDGTKEKMHFTPSAIILVILGFTTSTTFMLWMNCNQELGTLYGLADPSKIQSVYAVGIVVALFVNAALLGKGLKPSVILIIYPCVALATLAVVYFVQTPWICLVGGAMMGFFAAGGVLQLVSAVANEMFPKNRGVITSIVMISSSVANFAVLNVASMLTRMGGTNGPRLVLLFNMAVTIIGIVLAVILNSRIEKDMESPAEV